MDQKILVGVVGPMDEDKTRGDFRGSLEPFTPGTESAYQGYDFQIDEVLVDPTYNLTSKDPRWQFSQTKSLRPHSGSLD